MQRQETEHSKAEAVVQSSTHTSAFRVHPRLPSYWDSQARITSKGGIYTVTIDLQGAAVCMEERGVTGKALLPGQEECTFCGQE